MSKNKKTTFFNGNWVEESLIGEGSYGKVYKAKNIKKSREVCAIKNIKVEKSKQEIETLRGEGLNDIEIKEDINEILNSCEAEIKLMHDLKGSLNIVNIEDYEIIKSKNGYGFEINIRMELLERLETYYLDKELTNKDILKLGLDISKALNDCDKINIIHRDIKPDNIFVNKFGDYKLGDFGIARNLEKTTSGLSQKGTFNYIAPEVYKGDRYNKTVDIYSLGLVLYKYFNYNRLPFLPPYPEKITVNNREEAVTKRSRGDKILPPINASEKEAKVILKMISYDAKERYKKPDELIYDLENLLEQDERLLPKIEKKDNKVNTNLSVSKTELEKQKSKIEKTKFNKYLLIPIPIIILIISIVSLLIYQNNNYVMVPNLVNEENSVAIKKLDKLKLNHKVKYEVTEESKIGKILKQDIKNKKVRKKKTINLTVGISDEKVELIYVVGLKKEEAIKQLEELGLTVSITEDYNETIEKDKVISQMTEKGTKVNKGTVIEILVSRGTKENNNDAKTNEKNDNKKENSTKTNTTSPKTHQNQTTSPSPSPSNNTTPTPSPSPSPSPQQKPVTSMSIYGGTSCVKSGSYVQLSVNFYPSNATNIAEYQNATVEWSSNKPFVANALSNGKVHFVGSGTSVVITAKVNGLTASKTFHIMAKGKEKDLDGNGVIDANDASILQEMIRAGTADVSKHDYNGDGVVDQTDANILIDDFRTGSC